jgi:hypothetical protein
MEEVMSADNWTFCPRCREKHEKEWVEKVSIIEDLYGKIPAEEFISKREDLKTKPELELTFREDYEIGLGKDGKFSISYGGFCQICKFHFDYSYSKQVYPEGL